MNIEGYINEMGMSLERFKVENGGFKFRCNICGDSKKSSTLARGWFIRKGGEWFFHCFNCNTTLHISKYMQTYFPDLYKSYIFDVIRENNQEKELITPSYNTPIVNTDIIKDNLIPATNFKGVVKYLQNRKIPEEKFNNFFILKDFRIVKSIEKYKDSKFSEEPRLVLPIYNKYGNITGVVSRALKAKSLRYINLKFTDDENVYGIYDKNGKYIIDLNKDIRVVEGSIDSLFIDNAIASNCSDLLRVKKSFGFLSETLNFTFIPDNEPRNKEIVKVYEKIIEVGENIVFIPEWVEGKDINQYILKNENINIEKMITENSLNGLNAKLKFAEWKKVKSN